MQPDHDAAVVAVIVVVAEEVREGERERERSPLEEVALQKGCKLVN